MDSREFISTVENMDTTLAELGDEFTLGDIDGELPNSITFVLLVIFLLPYQYSVWQFRKLSSCWAEETPLLYATTPSDTEFSIISVQDTACTTGEVLTLVSAELE